MAKVEPDHQRRTRIERCSTGDNSKSKLGVTIADNVQKWQTNTDLRKNPTDWKEMRRKIISEATFAGRGTVSLEDVYKKEGLVHILKNIVFNTGWPPKKPE